MPPPDDRPPAPFVEDDETLTPTFALLLRSWISLVLLILCISLLQYLLVKLSG
jgi:uncharacterized membrane protein (DUF4010 family)